jgi:hypothetical protein
MATKASDQRVTPVAMTAVDAIGASDAQRALASSASHLLEALQRARNSEGDARLTLAGRVNKLLAQPITLPDRESIAHLLIDKLDDEAFHNLYDAQGLSCRAAAVEAVLNLGFPWALHVEPDDLVYLRTVKPVRSGGAWRAFAVVTALLAALFALAFFVNGLRF